MVSAVAEDSRLGIENASEPRTVVVDYSGPNIAKEMHVGHLRSTIIGDGAARILAFQGHNVIRQNHVGDWGTQFGRVVLAMWYLAIFERFGRSLILGSLIARQRAAAARLAVTDDKVGFSREIDELVREIVPIHQELLGRDPEGKVFAESLENDPLELDVLEEAYVFVSAITDSGAAELATIHHLPHGTQKLSEIPRLITRFIQDPDNPANAQEKRAWEKARAVTLDTCNALYARLDVQLADSSVQSVPMERGESQYNDDLPGVVADLRAKGLAVVSEGAVVVNVPGFAHPLIVEKRSPGEGKRGGFLYGTTDLAAIRYRVEKLGANQVVYFVDARQSQHFQQVFWIARAAGWANGVVLEHAPFGTMLGPDGKPFKTRSGDTVKLKSLLDEAEERAAEVVLAKNRELPEAQKHTIAHAVGIGAVKYADLSKDRLSDYIFSFDKMLALDGNTAPYLQYAHARVRSIFRRAVEQGAKPGELKLESPFELALAKHLLRLADVVALVARELKPHHLCTYLYELATKFSGFYENCPVLKSEEAVRASRLALCDVTGRTIALGLDLLGIEHPEEM
jgi:arginyl-tRNA synthetase